MFFTILTILVAPEMFVVYWPVPALLLSFLPLVWPGLPPLAPTLALALIALASLAAPPSMPIVFALWSCLVLLLVLGGLKTWPEDRLSENVVFAGGVHALFCLVGDTEAGRTYGLLGNPNVAGSLLAVVLPLAVHRRRWIAA